MKKIKYLLSIFTLVAVESFAQDALVIDGGSVYVTNNGLITVKGGVLNKNAGTIDNSGAIKVSGDWTNNGGNTMLMNNSAGTVTLDGFSQAIKGTSITDFYTLKLAGGSSVKSMFIDANVSNVLDLGNEELQTNSNTIYVTNPATSAVVWSTGYVNSDSLGGYLARSTNSTAAYTFPVGSSLLANTYRPVFISPTTTNSNVYGVRLSDNSPNTDNSGTSFSGATGPFPSADKGPLVRSINTEYYFNIARLIGTDAANVQVDFFSADGNFQTLAQWKGTTPRWEGLTFVYGPSSTGANLNSPDLSLTKNAVTDFNNDVFVLAEKEFTINVPGGVSPNGDGFNDQLVVDNLEYYPENEFVIFNRWGDVVFQAAPYLNDWSGQVNGSRVLSGDEVSDGTYFYVLKLSPNQETDPLKGSFELRRK